MSPSPTPHRIAVAIKTSLLHICYIPLFVIASSGLPDLTLEFASAWDKDMTFLPHLLTFCRITIGLLFAYSFLAKAQDVNLFAQTIANFKLLPTYWSRPLALLFLSAELAVVALLLAGGQFLPTAFCLATLLLVIFTIALLSVQLRQNIQIPCNCFGHNQKQVSIYDIWRNVGFIICGFLGWLTLSLGGGGHLSYKLPIFTLIFFIAIMFVVIWLNLEHIVRLFF